MADEEKVEKVENTEKKEEQSTEKATKKAGTLLPWLITAAVALICAGAGLGLGRFFSSPAKTTTNEDANQIAVPVTEKLKPDIPLKSSEKAWYFDLEPAIANLDEPGVTRYVRVTVTLEMGPEVDAAKGAAFLEEKKPLMTNWLTIYLASLNLERTRGEENLKRIQSEILDMFNEKLFADAKSPIKRVLFKEFAIQ